MLRVGNRIYRSSFFSQRDMHLSACLAGNTGKMNRVFKKAMYNEQMNLNNNIDGLTAKYNHRLDKSMVEDFKEWFDSVQLPITSSDFFKPKIRNFQELF